MSTFGAAAVEAAGLDEALFITGLVVGVLVEAAGLASAVNLAVDSTTLSAASAVFTVVAGFLLSTMKAFHMGLLESAGEATMPPR